MSKLYKIKPLEWVEATPNEIWIAGNYLIHKICGRFLCKYPNGHHHLELSLAAAKSSSENHRLALLTAELEPILVNADVINGAIALMKTRTIALSEELDQQTEAGDVPTTEELMEKLELWEGYVKALKTIVTNL